MGNVSNRQLPHNQNPAGWPTTTNAAQPTTQPWPTVRMPTVSPAASEILRDAVWHIDAAEHQASGANPKTVRNLGWGGSVLNARCGSTTVADTNDPMFLPYTGTPYVHTTGAGNYLYSPAAAPLNITGDLQLVWVGDGINWAASGGNGSFISKDDGATNRSYSLRRGVTSKALAFAWAPDGATLKVVTSTADIPMGTNGLKVTMDVDNGAGGNDVIFYTSNDFGVTWVELGNTVTSAGVTSLFSGNRFLQINAGSAALEEANVYRAQVYDGINGTLVFDADTSVLTSGSQTTFTEKSSNAATVTINRATSVRKSVAVVAPVWLFGTDDYMSVPNSSGGSRLLDVDSGASFTFLVSYRDWSPSTGKAFIAKHSTVGAVTSSWGIFNSATTQAYLYSRNSSGAIASAYSGNLSAGAIRVMSGQIDRATRNVTAWADSIRGDRLPALSDSLTNQLAVTVGAASQATFYADMEFMSAAIFRRALSASEIATLTTYYQGKYR